MISPGVYSLSSDQIPCFIVTEFPKIKLVFSEIKGVHFEFDCMLVGAQAYNILYPERRLPTLDCDFLINVYSSCETDIGLLICTIIACLSNIGGQIKSKI
ncbi:MAG: hypothetical protein NTV32_06380 [Gammaproteobacteria bacterium]|nr:hypothetical protein [Gammaproteobacteria bacterium]